MRRADFSLLVLLIISMLVLQGCNNDDPEPENEEELITTMTVTLTPVGGGNTITLEFSDPDGDGGQVPEITGGILNANTSYTAEIQLLNESVSPVEDITEEVKEEDDEHLFCYEVSGLDLEITRTDSDGTYEVGIETTWAVGAGLSEGEVTVILKHQPGIKDGTCGPGETDIQVAFPVEIQ